MQEESIQPTEEIKLSLTPVEPQSLIDNATIEAYNDYRKETLIGINKSLFDKSTIFAIDGYYFALSSFIENGMSFSTLQPFLINHKAYKKRAFAFGCIDTDINKIFLFWEGVKEEDRTKAIQIYNELKAIYNKPNLIIFAIKL